MTPDLHQLLSLVRQTNDGILWPEGGDWFVIMPLSKYKRQVVQQRDVDVSSLSEDALVAKINHDISEWRQSQLEVDDHLSSFGEIKPEKTEDTDPDEQLYLEPVE